MSIEREQLPLWRVMVRPRWILALLLALAVAAVFGWLSQWQLDRAVQNAQVEERNTETPVALIELAEPAKGITTLAGGHLATVDGHFAPGDEQLLEGRLNEGDPGFWVVSRFVVDGAASTHEVELAVARGWAPDRQAAEDAIAELRDLDGRGIQIEGRFMPSEAPIAPKSDQDPQTMSAMSVAALFNLWHDDEDAVTYNGYLVQTEAPTGLQSIHSEAPIDDTSLNWLNVFYAAEWIVFAGFAVYFWYRLTKDARERELELAAQAEEYSGSGSGSGSGSDGDGGGGEGGDGSSGDGGGRVSGGGGGSNRGLDDDDATRSVGSLHRVGSAAAAQSGGVEAENSTTQKP